jgi:hypothetical protein
VGGYQQLTSLDWLYKVDCKEQLTKTTQEFNKNSNHYITILLSYLLNLKPVGDIIAYDNFVDDNQLGFQFSL